MVATIVLAEAETAAREDWGHKFATSMTKLRCQYAYNHVNNTASIVVILKELAAVDTVRNLTEAPTPNTDGLANAATKMSTAMRRLVFDKDDTSEEGYAAVAGGYTSDATSELTPKSRVSCATTHTRGKARGRSNFRR